MNLKTKRSAIQQLIIGVGFAITGYKLQDLGVVDWGTWLLITGGFVLVIASLIEILRRK